MQFKILQRRITRSENFFIVLIVLIVFFYYINHTHAISVSFYCINLVNFTKKSEEKYSIGNRKFENYTTFL